MSQRCDAVQEGAGDEISHFLEKTLRAGTIGETDAVPRLRVATFNIRNGRGFDGRHVWWLRRTNTWRVIQALEADVLALQEVRPGQLRWLRRRLAADHDVIAVSRDGRTGRGEHLVLAVRRSVGSVAHHRCRWFSDTPDRPSRHPDARFDRCFLQAHIATRDGEVVVVGTHLDERSSSARTDAVRRLTEDCPKNSIVMGDFNCTIDDPALDPLFASGWRDALAPLPPSGPAVATHHAFTGRIDGTRIDHVFVPSTWSVSSARVVHDNPPGPWASDHWPVVAEIRRDQTG